MLSQETTTPSYQIQLWNIERFIPYDRNPRKNDAAVDRAMLAVLLGRGWRRAEAAKLQVRDVQQREEHWTLVDLMGKGRHILTVPVPDWVKTALDEWTNAAGVSDGRVFRCVSRKGAIWGQGITEKVVWHIVRNTSIARPGNSLPLSSVMLLFGVVSRFAAALVSATTTFGPLIERSETPMKLTPALSTRFSSQYRIDRRNTNRGAHARRTARLPPHHVGRIVASVRRRIRGDREGWGLTGWVYRLRMS